jgi:D-alanyl-D-alanine carboxypeptidase
MVVSKFRRRLSSVIACVALAVVALSAMTETAEARKRQRSGYSPPYASIVIDVNSGRMLQGVNPDAPRFPASVTKVMTLYMLFEQMERGKFRTDTPLRVSAEAVRQAPSKIGFDVGETIEVEDAIKALVTKSANDVAVVVAEAIGGDQDTFAEMMTAKARSLGMSRTTFKNASGLPNPQQVTTARDLATLGRAIHDRYPKYWRYFQTRNFEYAGRNYRNHNRLLGRVDGVDGIKTGYTRASGFNLLTSARDGNRHLMAVVLGGRSGRIRDAQMASLVENHLPRAYAGLRTAPMIAEARTEEPIRTAALIPDNQATKTVSKPDVQKQDVQKIEARPVAKIEIKAPEPKIAETVKPADAEQQRTADVRRAIAAAPIQVAPTKTVASTIVAAAPTRQTIAPVAAYAAAPQQPAGPQLRWNTGAKPVASAKAAPGRQAATAVAQADPVTTATAGPRSGYIIQLGASDDEKKARTILDNAKSRNRTTLADASAFTEKVQKGDATLFRARFGGFDDNKDANAACGALKKTGFNCFVQRI